MREESDLYLLHISRGEAEKNSVCVCVHFSVQFLYQKKNRLNDLVTRLKKTCLPSGECICQALVGTMKCFFLRHESSEIAKSYVL